MGVDLPYDVWLHITGHLSSDEVTKLYTVNHVLFSIAMDQRYKTGYVGNLFHSGTHRSLTRLIVPELAARVREFTFKPADLCRMLLEPKPKQYEREIAYLYDGLRRAIAGPKDSGPFRVKHSMPAETARKNIVTIMGQMTSLRLLKVAIPSVDEHRQFNGIQTPFFDPGWSAFGSSLRVFDLNIPLEDMARVLPNPLQPKFVTTNLETLSMSLRRALPSTDAKSMLISTVLPFINTIRHTLQFMVLNVTADIDASPLLLKINHIPALSSFQIELAFSSADMIDLTGLHQFFQTHHSHLASLSVLIMPHSYILEPDIFFSHECFTVKFKKLQHLRLCLNHFPQTYKVGVIPYIHQFKRSLVCLDIDSEQHFWLPADLEEFVKEFQPNILKELKIRVVIFDPALLITLSVNLPNLQTLHLKFRQLLPGGYITMSPGQRRPRFCEQMSHLSFTEWYLRSLNIKPGLHLINSHREACKTALVRSLPNVETFCGLGREEYVSSKDFV